MGDDDETTQASEREAHELAAVEQRLLTAFSPPLPPGHVSRTVSEARREFETARVRQYVPLLVERIARECLRTTARTVHEAASCTDGASPARTSEAPDMALVGLVLGPRQQTHLEQLGQHGQLPDGIDEQVRPVPDELASAARGADE